MEAEETWLSSCCCLDHIPLQISVVRFRPIKTLVRRNQKLTSSSACIWSVLHSSPRNAAKGTFFSVAYLKALWTIGTGKSGPDQGARKLLNLTLSQHVKSNEVFKRLGEVQNFLVLFWDANLA